MHGNIAQRMRQHRPGRRSRRQRLRSTTSTSAACRTTSCWSSPASSAARRASTAAPAAITGPRSPRWPWPAAACKMGQTVGESNARAEVPKTTPITPQDLMATVFHVLGIPQDLHYNDPTGRPDHDGQRRPPDPRAGRLTLPVSRSQPRSAPSAIQGTQQAGSCPLPFRDQLPPSSLCPSPPSWSLLPVFRRLISACNSSAPSAHSR